MSHTGASVSMVPEVSALPRMFRPWAAHAVADERWHQQRIVCDACGAILLHGDWPFCKGDPAQHQRGR